MSMKIPSTPRADTAAETAGNIVYVRRLAQDEIDRLVSDEAREAIGSDADLFAILNAEGQPLAVVEAREAAFNLARANALEPVSVH
jgi:hypothetical protein